MKSSRSTQPEISVVVAVRSAEDVIGGAVVRIAAHLRSLGRSFEILAVNAGSWDTSFPILRLLSGEVPELRLLEKDIGARAFVRGAAEATGEILVLMEAERVPVSFGPLGWALSRLAAGTEAVVVRGHFVLARRLLALPPLARCRGRGELFERGFEREAADLAVEVVGKARRQPTGFLAPVWRLIAV